MESSVTTGEQLNEIKPKMRFMGKVRKISLAGALLEIGEGLPAVIHISQMLSNTEEPIKRVEDVMKPGDEIEVWVRRVRENRVELSMIKPLDLEWRDLKKGMVVKGNVVRVEKFGAFVEIGAERPGLIHISEMAHGYVKATTDVVKEGDTVEAEVLDINRKKKQIKLSMKALQPEPVVEEEPIRPMRVSDAPQINKEKLVRRPKKRVRQADEYNDAGELIKSVEETSSAEAEPTAMEIAMRDAMEKAKTRKQQSDKSKKNKAASREQEDILLRTLDQKVPTN
jgi:small subunit ribosomal protein S1